MICNLNEGLSIVDTNNATNHLRHNDQVPEVSLHLFRLLTSRASRLALRSFLISAIGLQVKPRRNLLRAREEKSLTSSSVDISKRTSRSTPLKLNFLNVLFFGIPCAATLGSTSAMAATIFMGTMLGFFLQLLLFLDYMAAIYFWLVSNEI